MPWFPVPEGDDFDAEVEALRNNPEFLAYLAACKERARTRPRKTLAEMEELYCKPRGKRKEAKKTNQRPSVPED